MSEVCHSERYSDHCMNVWKSATKWEMKITIFPRVSCLVRKCPVRCPYDEMLMFGGLLLRLGGLWGCGPTTISRIGDPKFRWKNENIHRVRLDGTSPPWHNRHLFDTVPYPVKHGCNSLCLTVRNILNQQVCSDSTLLLDFKWGSVKIKFYLRNM